MRSEINASPAGGRVGTLAVRPQHAKPGRTLVALGAAGLAYSMSQSLVAPALPEFRRALDTDPGTVSWLLTAYLLSASVLTPVLGRLGDSCGKRRVLVLSLAAFTAGTACAAVAPDVELLIASRAVQGAAGAIFPLSFGIIRDTFPSERSPLAIGIMSAILGVGGGIGFLLAGPIVGGFGYRALFWLPLPLVVMSCLAVASFVPESPVRMPGPINLTGAILLAGWLTTGLLAITQGPRWGWASPAVLGLSAAAVMLFPAWVFSERRAESPLIDVRMMRRRGVWTVNTVSVAVGGIMYTTILLIPQFVDAPVATGYGFGASVIQGSLFLLPLVVLMLVVSPIAGHLCGRAGSRSVLIAGLSVAAAGFVMLAVVHRRPADVLIASGLVGIGLALSFSASSTLIVEAVPPRQTSVAAGMNAVMRTAGGAVGNAVAGALLASSTLSPGGAPKEQAFALAFGLGAASCTGAVVIAAMISAPSAAPGDSAGRFASAGRPASTRIPKRIPNADRPRGG